MRLSFRTPLLSPSHVFVKPFATRSQRVPFISLSPSRSMKRLAAPTANPPMDFHLYTVPSL